MGLSILPRPDGFSQKAGENHSALLHLTQISISAKDHFQKERNTFSCEFFSKKREIRFPVKDFFPFPPRCQLRISCFCRILDICCDAGEWLGIPMVPWLKPILRTLVAAMVTITKFLFLQNLDRCLRPGPNGPAGCQNFRHEIFKPATDLDQCHIWAPD